MTTDAHKLAKLARIIARLTRALPVDEQAELLALGCDADAPTPYRLIRAAGWNAVTLTLADGSVKQIGEFNASKLDEPLADE